MHSTVEWPRPKFNLRQEVLPVVQFVPRFQAQFLHTFYSLA